MQRNLWIDFEASGLGEDSYPIEFAWVAEDGTHATYLIRPEPGWTAWSGEAEELHGIARETLERDGRPAEEVARLLHGIASMPGVRLFSDAPAHDRAWAARLLGVLGERAAAAGIEIEDSAVLMGEACRPMLEVMTPGEVIEAAPTIIALAELDEDAIRHRALDDAVAQREAWLRVGRLVEQAVARHRLAKQDEEGEREEALLRAGMPMGCAG